MALAIGALHSMEVAADHSRHSRFTMLPGEVRMVTLPLWSDTAMNIKEMELPCRCVAMAVISSLNPGNNNVDLVIDAPLSEEVVRGDIRLIGSDSKGNPTVKKFPFRVDVLDFIESSPPLRRGEMVRLNAGSSASTVVEHLISRGPHPLNWDFLRLDGRSNADHSGLQAELHSVGEGASRAYRLRVSLRDETEPTFSGYRRETLVIQAMQNAHGNEQPVPYGRFPFHVFISYPNNRIYAVPGRLVVSEAQAKKGDPIIVRMQGSEIQRIAHHLDRITVKDPNFRVVDAALSGDAILVTLSSDVSGSAGVDWHEVRLDFGLDGVPTLCVPIVQAR